jgi:hypothetical protein
MTATVSLLQDAGVINKEVFAIMVLMAVVTTCMTSPLAAWIYPPSIRTPAHIGPAEASNTVERA